MQKLLISVMLLSLLGCGESSKESPASGEKRPVIGFSEVGAMNSWRVSFSESIKAEAERRGIELKFSDAQQKQENQIKAIRSFIAQGVDAIVVAPVVEAGWKPVLTEAKRAGIPVVIVDRNMALDDHSLYLTRIASDFIEEGRKAARWLMKATEGDCNIVELQGTVGSTASIDRKKGFGEIIDTYENAKIIRSQTGEFTRSKGKEVMEAFLKAERGGKAICAVWAHNDDMAIGAALAIKEAGLDPGDDILIVSVDAVPDIFKAMADGDTNATVELNPHMGGPAFDAIEAFLKGRTDIPKLIPIDGDIFTRDTAAIEYAKRGEQP